MITTLIERLEEAHERARRAGVPAVFLESYAVTEHARRMVGHKIEGWTRAVNEFANAFERAEELRVSPREVRKVPDDTFPWHVHRTKVRRNEPTFDRRFSAKRDAQGYIDILAGTATGREKRRWYRSIHKKAVRRGAGGAAMYAARAAGLGPEDAHANPVTGEPIEDGECS